MEIEDLIDSLIAKRINHGITQAEVSRKIGRSRVTIVQWERGYYYPPLLVLIDWAKALGYTLEFKLR